MGYWGSVCELGWGEERPVGRARRRPGEVAAAAACSGEGQLGARRSEPASCSEGKGRWRTG
jgi:hypothetical protein